MWAVVNSNGTLARGSGATSASNPSAGTYDVIFNKDVTGCAFEATAGSADASQPPLGAANVAELAGNPDGVLVTTYGEGQYNWSYVDEPFHLAVLC